MAFANDLANAGTFGLAGLALSKKKKPPVTTPPPSMIMSPTSSRPTSMIGGGRY